MVEQLSPALARRIALAAQGFGRPRPAEVGTRQLNGLVDRLRLLQIDSVNVFERSHYLPAFARLGPYDKGLLDRLTFDARGPHTEYWAHEAAFIRKEDWPLFRWRMRAYREKYGRGDSWFAANESTVAWLRSELAANGPLAASEIEHDANRRTGPWWGWSEVKRALERMFLFGEVAIAGRSRFQRRYALAEDVLPSHLLDEEPSDDDAIRELIRRSAVAHGIGTARDLADYYRLKGPAVTVALRELEESGELVPVRVAGWESAGRPLQAWMHRDARRPRRIEAAALLSPFDPVVWFRDRALRLFGFHYRIEIYTPAPQRLYGYYSLPILLDDALVGRIDLKSDRQAGVLRVQSAWSEPGAAPATLERLLPLLAEAADWQGLGSVEVAEGARGDLAPAIADVLQPRGRAATGSKVRGMTSPLDYLDEDGADEADYESPMRELYAYRDGDTWLDGVVTGVRPHGGVDGCTLVQFDDRIWVPARDVRASSHYIAVLLNPDSEVYAEVVQSYVDGAPKEIIRDVSVVGDGDNIGTEWRPIDEPQTGTRVRYRYTGTAELEEPDDEDEEQSA